MQYQELTEFEVRDDVWLGLRLTELWDNYFPDVERLNLVSTKFGRRAKRVLGSIREDKKSEASVITINRLLVSPDIPLFVIDAILVHEMIHYSDGFNSPHLKLRAHPHRGNVMMNEFRSRGLLDLFTAHKNWVKENWIGVLERNGFEIKRRIRIRKWR